MTDTDRTENAPPTPNPMNDGINPYPRPEVGPNWPLLDATRELIGTLPAGYDNDAADGQGWVQPEWRCSTGMCFAGWAAALTGAEFPYAADDFGSDWVEHMDADNSTGYTTKRAIVKDANGETWTVATYAMHVLGLAEADADRLFYGNNGLNTIDRVLGYLRDDHPTT